MWKQLQIWGDSLLKGVVFDEARNRYQILRGNCVAQLKALLPYPVENNARMGCTAPEGFELLQAGETQPGGLALLEFGGNDCNLDWAAAAADPTKDHQPKTPPEVFTRTLEQCVEQVRRAGMQPMLAVPPPLHARRYFDWVTRGLDSAAVLRFLGDIEHIYRWQERYALMVCTMASKLCCPLLNLRGAFLADKGYERLLCIDGIHPNALGHALMLDAMKAVLC
ncbi:MAG: SGNH/GDSL hydrolase family protein [Oscillospiraceae bacterium]|nr:SGNH/GDSL hydrolase family protein [Oscillospiraceae bacterium]